MEVCQCLMIIGVLVIQILFVFVDGSSLPSWKTQLLHFHKWKGYYVYQGNSHACQMVTISVQEGDDGGAYVSFTADDAHLDMTVFSDDDITIVFKMEVTYHPGNHFYDGFEFVVELLQYGNGHVFLGNVTKPASNSSTIRLKPAGVEVVNHMQSSDLSIGLAVGISVALFVVCVVVGIIILRWAIKKGYLRHVARSYKNFRNPEGAADPPVSFDNTQQESLPDVVNVHI